MKGLLRVIPHHMGNIKGIFSVPGIIKDFSDSFIDFPLTRTLRNSYSHTLMLQSHQDILLIREDRHPNHRDAMMKSFDDSVHSAMGEEQHRLRVS